MTLKSGVLKFSTDLGSMTKIKSVTFNADASSFSFGSYTVNRSMYLFVLSSSSLVCNNAESDTILYVSTKNNSNSPVLAACDVPSKTSGAIAVYNSRIAFRHNSYLLMPTDSISSSNVSYYSFTFPSTLWVNTNYSYRVTGTCTLDLYALL